MLLYHTRLRVCDSDFAQLRNNRDKRQYLSWLRKPDQRTRGACVTWGVPLCVTQFGGMHLGSLWLEAHSQFRLEVAITQCVCLWQLREFLLSIHSNLLASAISYPAFVHSIFPSLSLHFRYSSRIPPSILRFVSPQNIQWSLGLITRLITAIIQTPSANCLPVSLHVIIFHHSPSHQVILSWT